MMNIGDEIRRWRKYRGISKKELSKRTGCTQCHISRLENGKQAPTINTLEIIAYALGCDLNISLSLKGD